MQDKYPNDTQLETAKVLIVDQNSERGRSLQNDLSMTGYFIRIAPGGPAGIERASAWQPHLVLMESEMPSMSGADFCNDLRRITEAQIIVISAECEMIRKIEALDAGAHDYVTRPFSVAELKARIRARLRNRRLHK